MKKMIKLCKIGVMAMAIAGWCGMMYPELMMQEDMIQEELIPGEGAVLSDGARAYYGLLDSRAEEIEVKSRLLEWLQSIE